jgi:hypothetical protein
MGNTDFDEIETAERVPGRLIYGRNSKYTKELERWNQPYTHKEFPKMLYKAVDSGGAPVCDPFTRPTECSKIVNDPRDLQKALEAGWRESPDESIEFAKGRNKQTAVAAAERAYSDSKMSAKAQEEAAAYDKAQGMDQHVPVIPEANRKTGKRRAAAE